jgi:hypothetical protein
MVTQAAVVAALIGGPVWSWRWCGQPVGSADTPA